MRRPLLVFALIAAVLIAASGLAYYGFSYSNELQSRERAVIIDTMRELAEEKVIGIESELIKSDMAVVSRVDISNLLKMKEILDVERPAIESAIILDDSLEIIPGGFYTKREERQIEQFRKLLLERVIPDLNLRQSKLDERGHLHKYYDGRPYLFSHVRRFADGKTFYVVLEADLVYLIGTVFPQFFGIRSPRLYQVVDDAGELFYGYDFTRIPSANVVEMRFSETVSRWRLRVAQRKVGALATDNPRQMIDLVLIGFALAVIVTGLVILVLAMRRERRANELKSEFISNVSHELKTPLSIISMFGEMLAMGRTKSPAQATEYAEIICRESTRLARLIDNVLDFAKIERGAEAYEFAEGDPGEVVDRAIELSARRVQAANMELHTHIAPDLPRLSLDANALTLAVLNLIDNAIKYAPEGKWIDLEVQLAGDRVELTVHDHGQGIAKEEQERIFERFYRARAVRLKPIRGSGIGLALVKHIADAHGGGVDVSSEPGQGATFRLWIPVSSHR